MSQSDKAAVVKKQVDEVVDIMNQNIQKVVERGESLNELEGKTDDLAKSSQQFNKAAVSVKRNLWWKNMKLNLLIGLVVVIIVTAIVVPIVVNNNKKSDSNNSAAN